jgi:outer membrane protein assembly factor BamB
MKLRPSESSTEANCKRLVRLAIPLQRSRHDIHVPQILALVAFFAVMVLQTSASDAEQGALQTQASTPSCAPTTGYQIFLPIVANPSGGSGWPMAGANPQRTSWTPDEVRGNLSVAWYRPMEPYIPYEIQPIAANGAIYVATARGLYAFRASDGSQLWVYPAELPLGNSPTIAIVCSMSVAYVGGYDRQIHAIDTNTGQTLPGYSPYQAMGGFDTNPLVIQDTHTGNVPVIFAGNRDGYFYALNAATGAFKWKYQTDGPISFSAAYKNGVLYFASQDMHAYALNASDGSLVWKSAKLPGGSFKTYWPVVYANKSNGKDYVVFTGDEGYRQSELSLTFDETSIFNAQYSGGVLPTGNVAGDWAPGTVTMDTSIITSYYANKPYRRRVFFLDSSNGQEYTFTDPVSGKTTYAPFSWSGVTHGGEKFPGIVNGLDGVYYQQTAYDFGGWVTRGSAVGWKFGTSIVSLVSQAPGNPNDFASDEPQAYSSGGKLIYWDNVNDRSAGGFDVTIPVGQPNRAWTYWNNVSLPPNYDMMYNDGNPAGGWLPYSGKNQSKNGVYGRHLGTQSPPIPYQGKVYVLRGNTLLAFSPTGTNPQTPLPLATIVPTQNASTPPTPAAVAQRLAVEVQKMLSAGPLRPGYHPAGMYQQYGEGHYTDQRELGEIFDYFQNPADTVYTLLSAYPYLAPDLQTQMKSYLQNNYGPGSTYDFTKIVHIGWGSGAPREWADMPPDVLSINWGSAHQPPLTPSTQPICGFCGYWQHFPPFSFYAAWKYAQIVGNSDTAFAKNIFNSMSGKIEPPASDSFLLTRPHIGNLYLAGYLGYLQLKGLAGLGGDATVQGYFDHVLSLRTSGFSKDTAYWNTNYVSDGPGADMQRTLAVAQNFMFLTPETGDLMSQRIQSQVQTAVDEYNYVAPYWFVPSFEGVVSEGEYAPLYDYAALFQAKAYILKQPFNELVKYLDVPGFRQGDLFYIQNLVAALSAH